jgi:hypothetical protein
VENKKTMMVKFRRIIFSTIMGSVPKVWPKKCNSGRHRAFTTLIVETLSQILIFLQKA